MFHQNRKREALERLEAADKEYQVIAQEVTEKATELYETRKTTAEQVIQACENYINTLANSPKEFDKSVSELKIEFARFNEVVERIRIEAEQAVKVASSAAGAGAVAGVGVAAFAPTAAMAIATTFGTASTGTAISALSGAAATNAALAWLGGGALAAGGGGMAAGNALLALAGPVGWAIGGTAIVGGLFLMDGKNEEIAEKANQETVKIKAKSFALKAAKKEIEQLLKLTQQHTEGVIKGLNFLLNTDSVIRGSNFHLHQTPDNYLQFSQEQKDELSALINNIQALSKLLNKQLS